MSSHESDNKKPSPRGRGRGRGRPPGRGAAKRGRKKAIQYVTKENNENKDNVVMDENELNRNDTVSLSPKFDETTDSITPSSISFVTSSYDVISRPLHKNEPLNWKYKVNLIGEKVVNPRIHCCDNCVLPILVYGRMIPCKHVFCLSCAKQSEKICIRCTDKVIRVEKSGLGTVFMCQTESCKRTYLSQRDLQAHIQHRHMRRTLPLAAHSPVNTSMTNANVNQQSPRVSYSGNSSGSFQSPIPVVSSRSNLITVPIQEEVSANMNQMSQSVAQQTQMMVTNQQINNYPPQPPPYSHHSSHMQWPPMGNAPPGFAPYRPSWPPMPMQQGPPYNPYNRPYFPQ